MKLHDLKTQLEQLVTTHTKEDLAAPPEILQKLKDILENMRAIVSLEEKKHQDNSLSM